AARQLAEAEAIARPLGMELVLTWIAETRAEAARVEPARAAARAAGVRRGQAAVIPFARRPPGEAADAGTSATEPIAAADEPSAAMRRDGELWTITFGGRTTRLRHMVGLAHLA